MTDRIPTSAHIRSVGAGSEFGGVVAEEVKVGEEVQHLGWPRLIDRLVVDVHGLVPPGAGEPVWQEIGLPSS